MIVSFLERSNFHRGVHPQDDFFPLEMGVVQSPAHQRKHRRDTHTTSAIPTILGFSTVTTRRLHQLVDGTSNSSFFMRKSTGYLEFTCASTLRIEHCSGQRQAIK